MNYIEGFRDGAAARALGARLGALGRALGGRGVRLMEVCGTHTMAVGRFGLRDLLPEGVELLSGPGCPVCVTGAGYIDAALELAARGALLATFGDLMRVPGSRNTLQQARAEGARVEVCYSPEAALGLARGNPGVEVVFLGIGFETTAAPVASLMPMARAAGLDNLSLLAAFKRVVPALEALSADPELGLDGYLCPPHVSAVIGAEAYRAVVERFGLPCLVAGFEPLDILHGLVGLLEMVVERRPGLVNHYSRVVRCGGNPRAQALLQRCLEPAEAHWRGIGRLPGSGLAIREEWARYDAARRFGIAVGDGAHDLRCRCGEVLRGAIKPIECGLFGSGCTPDHPVGACMVSSEGSCAAWFKYAGGRHGGR